MKNAQSKFWTKPLVLLYLLLPGLIIFREYLFGDKLFLFVDIASDSINLMYPKLVMYADTFRENGLFSWSFREGLGRNIFNRVGNPFNWVYIFLGRENIPYCFIYVEYFKLMLSGIFFYAYLRMVNQTLFVSLIGGLLYAYCASIMLNMPWLGISVMALGLALGLWTIERLFQKGRWRCLPILGFFVGTPIYGLQLGMTLIAYALIRFIGMQQKSLRWVLLRGIKGIGFVLMGTGIKLFIYPSTIKNMLNSPRGSGEYSYKKSLLDKGIFHTESLEYYWTVLYRFFSNDLLGNGIDFQGWYNYFEAPALFVGLLPLVLLSQMVIIKNKRIKYLFVGVLTVVFISLIFPFFRNAFWFFIGAYFRYFGHVVLTIFLLMSLYILKEILQEQKVNLIALGIVTVCLIGILFVPSPYSAIINDTLRWVVVGFIALYTLLLVAFHKLPQKVNLSWMLLVLIPIEIVVLGHFMYHNRMAITVDDWKAKKGYNDYTNEIISEIGKNDKGFFRIEKNYFSGPSQHTSLNDAKVQQYFSSPNYASLNQIWYVRFLVEMGLIQNVNERKTRWVKGVGERTLLCFLTNTKYKLVKGDGRFAGNGYTSVGQVADIQVFQNQLFLPFGHSYDKIIPYELFKQLDDKNKDVALLKALVVDNPNDKIWADLETMNLQNIPAYNQYDLLDLQTDIGQRREGYLQISSFKQNEIQGTVELNTDKALFFSIPYDTDWHAYVNGEKRELIRTNIGFMALPLKAGQYKIELKHQPFMLKAGLGISFLFLLANIVCYVFYKKELD